MAEGELKWQNLPFKKIDEEDYQELQIDSSTTVDYQG
jgi:hypothetical protein